MPDILRHVRRAVLASLLLLAGSFFADRASAEDSYLLALAWQPGFCADQAHADFSECKIAPKDQPRLVLHGLWPDWDANGDGKRNAADDFCIPGDDNRNSMMALDKGNWLKLPPMKLSQASSNDLAAAMPGTAAGLDRHEWWKHGTCSKLPANEYFAIAIALLRDWYRRGVLPRNVMTFKTEEVITAMQQGRAALTNQPFGRIVNYNDPRASRFPGEVTVILHAVVAHLWERCLVTASPSPRALGR